MDNLRFMYVRDANWEPIGCLAITINRSKNRAEYGLSMRNPKDAYDDYNRRVRFDRKFAQKLAQINMDFRDPHGDPKRVFIPSNATMHDITESVLKDIVARGTAPSGAVKFAKGWLRAVGVFY